MVSKKSQLDDENKLRRRAEERLLMKRSEKEVSQTDSETERLLQELQVHQIELEMQNTELCRIKNELELSLARYTDLYDLAPVAYLTISRDGVIQEVNLSGVNLLGRERSRLLGQPFVQLVIPEDRAAFVVFLKKVFTSRGKIDGSVALLNMKEQPLIVQIEAVMAASKQECLFALIDITKNRQYEEKLHYLNTHDTLTGLFNRPFFDAELERLMESRLYPVSVIIADVDELKKINDTFGHAAGDQMIKLAAKVLRHAVRPEDVIARIGGDEFAILLPQTASTDEALVRMRQCHATIQCSDGELPLQLSLGSATAHNSKVLKESMLLADLRMYEDKNQPAQHQSSAGNR